MHILLTALGCLFVYMTLAFVVSLIRKDNGVADVAYGGGFMLLAWVSYALGAGSIAGLVASILTTVWGVRLAYRIYRRNRGKPEDFRYRTWREEWGSTFVVRSFFQVYMLQGSIIFLVALPVLLLNAFSVSVTLVAAAYAGITIWLVGFLFEAVGDAELDAFIRNPASRGKIMDQGLWRYTRHPNYFGESFMWWGIALIACGTLFPVLGVVAFIAFLSPLLITFLLLKVSGIPMLEKRFAGEPLWEAYKAKTSAFIPLPPKR